jgi:hypothetical protein
MRALLFVLAALSLAQGTHGQTGQTLTLDYSNPGLAPPHWVMTLAPDGSGHFHADRGPAPAEPAEQLEVGNVDRDIKVSTDFASRAFDTARGHKYFASGCESHMKVAFQGWKKFTYAGPDGSGGCIFNYSKDKEIENLGESLVAVAATLVEGARLESLLRHDRLGLDKEIEYLSEAAGDGRVQQLGTIRGILEQLADDPAVMDRVRKRARELLTKAESTDGLAKK